MKNKIPADVERLMWMVAESNDPSAIQDFENRFPAFGPELAKRRRMVSDLKHAKSNTSVADRIPAFTPRETVASAPSRGTWVVASIALAAVAVASYSATSWITKEKRPLPKPEPVITTPVVVPDTTVRVPANPPVQTPPVQTPPTQVPQPWQAPVMADPPSNQESLKTLKLSNTSLIAALKMIGEMAGYRVEVAPGLPDQQISVDYDQVTTSEMLKDLGSRYGFTPFDQGDGSIIIVPAIDQAPPGNDLNSSSRRIG